MDRLAVKGVIGNAGRTASNYEKGLPQVRNLGMGYGDASADTGTSKPLPLQEKPQDLFLIKLLMPFKESPGQFTENPFPGEG